MTNETIASHHFDDMSKLLAIVGQSARVQILLVISTEEACVCHLEAVLGMRQATISQHLMALRKANLVTTQREGRNIFYRLAYPEVTEILERAAQLAGLNPVSLRLLARRPVDGCPCPQCNPGMDPDLTCQRLPNGRKTAAG